MSVGDNVVISLRPEKIRIASEKILTLNCFSGKIVNTVYIGSDARVVVELGDTSFVVWEQNKISILDPEAYYTTEEQVWVVILPENALVLHDI